MRTGTWILWLSMIYGIIIPTDFNIFQRGRCSTNQILRSLTMKISHFHDLPMVFSKSMIFQDGYCTTNQTSIQIFPEKRVEQLTPCHPEGYPMTSPGYPQGHSGQPQNELRQGVVSMGFHWENHSWMFYFMEKNHRMDDFFLGVWSISGTLHIAS